MAWRQYGPLRSGHRRRPRLASQLFAGFTALFEKKEKAVVKIMKRPTVITFPSFILPIALLAIAGAEFAADLTPLATFIGVLGVILAIQATSIRFVLDDEGQEVVTISDLENPTENAFIVGRNGKVTVKPKTVKKDSETDRGSSGPGLWGNVTESALTFTSQLMTHFQDALPGDLQLPSRPIALKVFEEAVTKEQEVAASTATADLSPLLASVGVWETKHVRKLSALTAIVYKMDQVTPVGIKKRFNLDLVTSSTTCLEDQFGVGESPEEFGADGDGMSVPFSEIVAAYEGPDPGQAEEYSKEHHDRHQMSMSQSQQQPNLSPTDLVSDMVSDAWGAAAEAATTAAGVIVKIFALSSSFDVEDEDKFEEGREDHHHYGTDPQQLQPQHLVAAEAAHTAYMAVREQNNASPDNLLICNDSDDLPQVAVRLSLTDPTALDMATLAERQAAMVYNTSVCPSQWFVCDEESTRTRYFAIQGSDSLDHWKMNFAFDPVWFEDAALGVKVHRGAYEAAEVLYQRFLPLVSEYVEAYPFAKICFTGHSIGGSLATLLALMYKMRGVLQEHNIATVYTFGAPPVFLEPTATLHTTHHHHETPNGVCPICAKGPYNLLSGCGLAEHVVRNVILPYDLVPRSMSCDFSPVADILRNMSQVFAVHPSLNMDGRKHLYAFVGRMMVMQGDRDLVFFAQDDHHPMFPSEPGLWIIGGPENDEQPSPSLNSLKLLDAAASSSTLNSILPADGLASAGARASSAEAGVLSPPEAVPEMKVYGLEDLAFTLKLTQDLAAERASEPRPVERGKYVPATVAEAGLARVIFHKRKEETRHLQEMEHQDWEATHQALLYPNQEKGAVTSPTAAEKLQEPDWEGSDFSALSNRNGYPRL
eukprot:gene7834-1034_t